MIIYYCHNHHKVKLFVHKILYNNLIKINITEIVD